MRHFGWTEDDILYEDHEQDWYEDDDHDTVAESNGESEWGDAQSWEEWEEDWVDLIEEHDAEVDF